MRNLNYAELNERFEAEGAETAIRWAVDTFGRDLIVASSFEDAVLIDLAVAADPGVEVLFLDTQYHFAETLWFVEEVRRRYKLNLHVEHPDTEADNRWQWDVEGCCNLRKVIPLNRGLSGKSAWITGLRRVDAPTRANAPIVSWDESRSMVKLNPLAAWSDEQLDEHVRRNDLPMNPVTARGIPSVGCWPCTRPVAPGEDRRAGRWAGSGKVECGLHVNPSLAPATATAEVPA
ncbi:MAG: phosphoadenylyl-sulfate reductase [Acidimicrobiia bacterium]